MKFNILNIPDLHGRDSWKNAVNSIKSIDKVIFLGDYLDSKTCTDDQILTNFADVLEFKIKNKDLVTLLLGNHELHYLYSDLMYSGFRSTMYSSLHYLINSKMTEHKDLFSVAYSKENYLFTHAGVTSNWIYKFETRLQYWADLLHLDLIENIAEILNAIQNSRDSWILHEVGYPRGGIHSAVGGITWADESEIKKGIPRKWHQIVGHNKVKEITKVKKFKNYKYDDRSATFTDCLTQRTDFLILEIES